MATKAGGSGRRTAGASCPRPGTGGELVTLAHGAGGRAMRRLVRETLARGFLDDAVDGIGLAAMDDGAAVRVGDAWLVVTTDSHVIHPTVFPGGDIGVLAVAGTVNDLAMMGATEPLGLTSAVIVEEGYPRRALEAIQGSMRKTAAAAGVPVLTGDTKVMGRGELDGLVINTTGIALTSAVVPDAGLRPGDRIVVTGSIGDHGIALMAERHGLEFGEELRSDVAAINALIRRALAVGDGAVTALKDPTRGGLASALHEMAEKAGVGVVLEESRVPVTPVVRSAAEILGLDPFHIANEGKAVLGVRKDDVDEVLEALQADPLGRDAAVVGEVVADHPGRVILDTGMGRRLVTEPEGEPLPRIC
ncbi:MAG TPA: hydrogenase expression/formation protein HypE [Longimicrobiales bacterium]|nr:hydrogenase expression/formation protein HypE [Longimicrobiales bacterium]